eukprot:CAMPEP_0194396156 /NCGR_PEP_ID=MMETSP0174-20130528/124825_1 /TAXON_ID=216777 /ORGANISM="Proboscia alata, Strain PI-D3" /LENGTH=84 /DNA_ID=CAMNT_0039192177 /DNA_START=1311 /DNA_END=1561 /DNA_ORIENTATION=-
MLLNRFGYSPATSGSSVDTNETTHKNHPDPDQPASIVMTPLPKGRDVHYNIRTKTNNNSTNTNTIRVNDKKNGYNIRQPNDLYG